MTLSYFLKKSYIFLVFVFFRMEKFQCIKFVQRNGNVIEIIQCKYSIVVYLIFHYWKTLQIYIPEKAFRMNITDRKSLIIVFRGVFTSWQLSSLK